MKNAWFQSGSNFSIDEVTSQLDKLPVAVYKLQFNELVGKFYLTRISRSLSFLINFIIQRLNLLLASRKLGITPMVTWVFY